uniref:Ig-like domain-containing protein n=1 Tax=Dicentrarchus labrax TaxID=13489 RepID=A0A8C4GED8_DICLA
MFVLIWATLLFSVRGSSLKETCKDEFCITLSEGGITAEAGLCAVIPCSFTAGPNFTPQNINWYKCESEQRCDESDIIFHTKMNNNKNQSGRVSLLEPDVSQKNCSIIINDLTESDSGSYWLRVNGNSSKKTDDGFTYTPKATVSVKDPTQKPTVMIPPLTEGQQTTLICTAPGLCSGSRPKITWTWRGTGENDSHITANITEFKTENLTAVTQRHSSTLTFNPSAKHHGTKVTCKVSFTNSITIEETVTLNVTYMKPVITGNTTVKEGHALNLTCSVESFPLSNITWSILGSNANRLSEPNTDRQNNSGSATLVIHNVTAEHSGQYICTAQHLNRTVTVFADVTVTWISKVFNNSGCKVQSQVLTCVCISEGFPLPTIKWPLLKNYTEYSVHTTVSNHTVNSTVTLSIKDHSSTTVECVSSNEHVEAKENLTVQTDAPKQEDLLYHLLMIVQPQIIIAFVIGILLSATICCLARKCHRKKQKSSGNTVENLEMVTTQVVQLMDAGQSVENDETHGQEAAEGEAEAAGQSAPNSDVEPKEVEYSDIDFSKCTRKSPRGTENTQETAETEYAEIKKVETEEREDNAGEDGENLGNQEEVAMIGEDNETRECIVAEEEDVAVYSNVNEIMAEI